MKRLSIHIPLVLAALLFAGCSDEKKTEDTEIIDIKGVVIETLNSEITDPEVRSVMPATRAKNDYYIAKADVPMNDITKRALEDWRLHIDMYFDESIYAPASGDYEWNTTDKKWLPKTPPMYFPNYFSPKAELTLSHKDRPAEIAIVQNTEELLLRNDYLIERGNPEVVKPAHIFKINIKHAFSSIDFILKDVEDIDKVEVTVGNKVYEPCKVSGSAANYLEYMLIIPTGVPELVVEIYTKAGGHFRQKAKISGSSKADNCYCFTVVGPELIISPVTVVDWTAGGATIGDYIGEAAYPTFRGPRNDWCILTFDNGLRQTIDFNEYGELTVKPKGRRINRIETSNGRINEPDPALFLREMVIDLNGYIDDAI